MLADYLEKYEPSPDGDRRLIIFVRQNRARLVAMARLAEAVDGANGHLPDAVWEALEVYRALRSPGGGQ